MLTIADSVAIPLTNDIANGRDTVALSPEASTERRSTRTVTAAASGTSVKGQSRRARRRWYSSPWCLCDSDPSLRQTTL
jgi:hypothetical protein